MQKKKTRLLCLLIVFIFALSAAMPAFAANARPQDDYYEAINGNWISSTKIGKGEVITSAFQDLSSSIQKQLIADLDAMRLGKKSTGNTLMKKAVSYYTMASDFAKRNKDGVTSFLPYLARIENLDYAAFKEEMADLIRNDYTMPFSLSVDVDLKNTSRYALWFGSPALILPDPAYYSGNQGAALLKTYADMMQKLLKLTGKTASQASTIVQQALAFDKMLVPYASTAVEMADVSKLYNPVAFNSFSSKTKGVGLGSVIATLTGQQVDKVIVSGKKFYAAFDTLISQKNFELIRSWMVVQEVRAAADYLTDEFYRIGSEFTMKLYGLGQPMDKKTAAFYLTTGLFGDVISDYYGKTYFGENAKRDVEKMVQNMVAVYRTRLENNAWLSSATKAQAIKKLDNLEINIGYPDEPGVLSNYFMVDTAHSLFENYKANAQLYMSFYFELYGEQAERGSWGGLHSFSVNAQCNLTENSILFPAAILQAPFYSTKQSESANYGGIGAVIAHEISHLFDPNGSQFDENGNMKNWWTKSDHAQFDLRAQAVADLFNGIAIGGGTVDGKLTLGENIADLGGVSCALEVVKSLPNGNLEEFFTSWAKIWRSKSTSEYGRMLLATDEHAPDKLRVNIILSNFEEFHQTYNVQPGDAMYRKVEDRVHVW